MPDHNTEGLIIEAREASFPFMLAQTVSQWPSSIVFRLRDGQHLAGNTLEDFSPAQLRELNETNQIDWVTFESIPFRAKYPNANFIRFRDEDLGRFFKSFGGQPFLRDHAQRFIDAREGTIVRSRRIEDESFPAMEHQTKITNKAGIDAFINGQIDRFSIGWDASGITCSICGDNWFRCTHWLGMEYEINEGRETQICELIFEDPTGVEASAVNRPAVDGTRILSVLSDIKNKTLEVEIMARPKKDKVDETPADQTVDTAAQVAALASEEAAAEEVEGAVGAMTVEQLAEALGLDEVSEAIVRVNESLTALREEIGNLPDYDAIADRISNIEQAVVGLAGEAMVSQRVSHTPQPQQRHVARLQEILGQQNQESMVDEPDDDIPLPKTPRQPTAAAQEGSKRPLKIVDHSEKHHTIAQRQAAKWNGGN